MELASYYLLEAGCQLDLAVETVAALGPQDKRKYDFTGDVLLVDEDSGEVLARGATFCRQESMRPPAWYDLIRAVTNELLADRLYRSAHAGIIIVEAVGRVWAIGFGAAYRDIEELPVESRFGRIAVSNAIDDVEALRGFVGQTFGRDAKVRIESTNRDGPIDRLSFLEQSNRLKKLRARVEFEGESCTVEGGVSFRFPRAETATQLVSVLRQMLAWWNGGAELRAEIADKDPVSEIVDERRTALYEAEYEAALRQGGATGFFLSLDLEEYWTANGYGLKLGPRRVAEVALPDTSIMLQAAQQYLDCETPDRRLRLECDLPSGSQSRHIRDVLSYERPQRDGEAFVVVRDDGRWWEYRTAWVRRIDEAFVRCMAQSAAAVDTLGQQLTWFNPNAYISHDPEEEWILAQKVAVQGAEKLHRVTNIYIDGARSPVELADLFCPGPFLLSVKRGEDLKRIDEVAGQVEAAARMLVREPEYRMEAQRFCDQRGLAINFGDRATIRLGCVTIARQPKLSIRAKERIVRFFRTVTDYNYQPVWIFVEVAP